MLALPVFLGITAWNMFRPSERQLPFSFALPKIGVMTMLIYVLSVVFHELGHLLAARQLGADVEGVGFGVRLLVPQFFVKIDNVSFQNRRRIASAGYFSNFLIAAIAVAAAWGGYGYFRHDLRSGVTVQQESNNFRKYDTIQEIAGQAVMDNQQFRQIIQGMQDSFYQSQFVFDDKAEVDAPVLTQNVKQHFGALELPFAPFEYDSHGQYSLLTQRYINGEVSNVLQPVRLTINS